MAIDGYQNLEPFRFWCQTVLPTVYDESLSYYELLNKVVAYLNTIGANVDALNTYIETYFTSEEVQQMINDSLNKMVEDGTFDAIIADAVANETDAWLSEHITQPGTAISLDSSFELENAAAQSLAVGQHTLNWWDRGESADTPIVPGDMPGNKFIFAPLSYLPDNGPASAIGLSAVTIVMITKLVFTNTRFMLVVYDAYTGSKASQLYVVNDGVITTPYGWAVSNALNKTNTAYVLYEPELGIGETLDVGTIPQNSYCNIATNLIQDPPVESTAQCRLTVHALNASGQNKLVELATAAGTVYYCRFQKFPVTESPDEYYWHSYGWKKNLDDAVFDTDVIPNIALYQWTPPENGNISITDDVPLNKYCHINASRIIGAPALSTTALVRLEVTTINGVSKRFARIYDQDGKIYQNTYTRYSDGGTPPVYTWTSAGWSLVAEMGSIKINASTRDSYFIDANNAPANSQFVVMAAGKVMNTPYDFGTTSNSFSTYVGVPAWVANHAYMTGAFVTYDGEEYMCAVAHTSGSEFAAANWRNVAWDNETIYAENTIVKYNGGYYYCSKGMTSSAYDHNPPVNGSGVLNAQWWKVSYENPVLRNIGGFVDGTLFTFGSINNANAYYHQTFICGTQAGSGLGYVAPTNCRIYTRTYFKGTGWGDWQVSGNAATPHSTNVVLMKKLLAPYLTLPYGTVGAAPCMYPTENPNPMYVKDPAFIHDLNDAPIHSIYQIDLDAVGDTDPSDSQYYECLAHNPLPGVSGTVYTYCWSMKGKHAKVQLYVALNAGFANLFYRYQYIQSQNVSVWTPWRSSGYTRYAPMSATSAPIVVTDLPGDWIYYGRYDKVADFAEGGRFEDAPFSLSAATYLMIRKTELVANSHTAASRPGVYEFTSATFKYECWRTGSGNVWRRLDNVT